MPYKFSGGDVEVDKESYLSQFKIADDASSTSSTNQHVSFLSFTDSSAFRVISNTSGSIQPSALPEENGFVSKQQPNGNQPRSSVSGSAADLSNQNERNQYQNQFQSPANSRYNFDSVPEFSSIEKTPDMMRLHSDLLSRQLRPTGRKASSRNYWKRPYISNGRTNGEATTNCY